MFLNPTISNLSAEVFRLSNRLLATCDALVSDIGLSSARLQVLEVMALSSVPQSVAQIARKLELTRQAVQRLANEMASDGFVRFESIPHHGKAKAVLFTAEGRVGYANAVQRLEPLATKLGLELTLKEVKAATSVLKAIRHRLESEARDVMKT